MAAVVVAAIEPVDAQRGRGQGPGAATGAPQTPREMAPVDLTGTWVSVVHEDWHWRMTTPARGDYASVPLNPLGRKVADGWTPAEAGSCKGYGAPALLRRPGRLRISWQDDNTLKIEADAGAQTRLLHFGADARPGAPSLQGFSRAEWQVGGNVLSTGAGGATVTRVAGSWGTLKVVTTGLAAGWLRPNGVPYSESAVLTEYFDRFSDLDDEWFTVTTIVEDPIYLTQPFIISSNFKREPDGSRWDPAPCRP
ncbi:MAG TPA: hypothetical protein VNI78_08350 [Vicinamibacterales bacterium]|nr:hypothetical protein [Vicinamibacterales bacterium]